MKYIYILLSLIICSSIDAQIVDIPDTNFKAKLLEADPDNFIATNESGEFVKVDINDDGEIQESEAELIWDLRVFSSNISDLTGVQSFTNLKRLFSDLNNLSTVNLDGMQNLEDISLEGNSLTSFSSTNLDNLQNLLLSNNNIITLDVSGYTNLIELRINSNGLTSLTLSNPNLTLLSCFLNELTDLDLNSCTNIENLYCYENSLSNIVLSSCINMIRIEINDNNLTLLDCNNLTSLEILDCSSNSLTSLLVNGSGLFELTSNNNSLTTLDLSGCPTVYYVTVAYNNLTSINLTNCTNLNIFDMSVNQLTDVDISTNSNLYSFKLNNNNISDLEFSYSPSLFILEARNNQFESLDFSANSNLSHLDIRDNSNLANTNIKNGFIFNDELSNSFEATDCPSLAFVCVDNDESQFIHDYFVSTGQAPNINEYCSFTPAGDYNSISGSVIYDIDDNGCDNDDFLIPYHKVLIDAGTNSGGTFSKVDGQYDFFVETGEFDISSSYAPNPIFSISPGSYSHSFTDNDNNITSQDFCISSVGVHKDLDIIIVPITPARPGFEGEYLISCSNKGNQILSGNIEFLYNDELISNIYTSLLPLSENPGIVIWDYSDLKPFEHINIYITLTVNFPSDVPPVNIGDILEFSASITPLTEDETPLDNTSILNQVVVGSYDPNNIVCVEGEVLPTSDIGSNMHYVINFENTGNYPAENIVVKMIINPIDFDINTLELLNSSDDVYIKLTNDTLEFIFEDINLEYGGHGNILMMIQSNDNLVLNSIVSNYCDIFFDYNYPVTTNEANTVFQDIINAIDLPYDNAIIVLPNPVNDFTIISSGNTIRSINVFDSKGRIVLTKIVDSKEVNLCTDNLMNGVYFIKIISTKGIKYEKIIKQ